MEENIEIQPDASSQKLESDIYTMPEEFYAPLQKSSPKWTVIILGIIGVLIVFGGATAYVLFKGTFSSKSINENDTFNTTLEDVKDTSPISPVVDDVTIIEQPDDDSKILEDNLDTERVEALPPSLDFDSDGLTDIEEGILGIDSAKDDSDGDGFLDGAELVEGYDPSQAGKGLIGSKLFKTYTHNNPHFTADIPAEWTEAHVEGDNVKVTFLALNNDIIIFTIFNNVHNQSIDDWFVEQDPKRSIQELVLKNIGGILAKESAVRRTVYIPLEDRVLQVEYDVGGKKEIAFPSIWNYILSTITF